MHVIAATIPEKCGQRFNKRGEAMETQEKRLGVNLLESGENQAKKKPYERPGVIYCAPLEAMASVCTTGAPPKSSTAFGCEAGFLFS
jgi:hypothetical protein